MFGGIQPETDLPPVFLRAQVLEIFFPPEEKGYTLPAGDLHDLVVIQAPDHQRAGGSSLRSICAYVSTDRHPAHCCAALVTILRRLILATSEILATIWQRIGK